MKRYLLTLVVAILAVAALSVQVAAAEPELNPDDTMRILFIGNSFTQLHNIPDQVKAIIEHGKPELKVETMRVIYGGSQAERHWNNYGTANLLNLANLNREDLQRQIDEMTKEAAELQAAIDTSKANGEKLPPRAERHVGHFKRAIRNHQQWMELLAAPPSFDYVVLQSYRDELAGLDSSYAEYARKFAEVIHQHGARMLIYSTAQRVQNGEPLTELPDPAPFLEKAKYLATLAHELDALVVPVALSIHKLREQRLDLTTRYTKDSHLNYIGAYLTLCGFYGALLDESPVGLDWREVNAWTKRIDPDGNPMHQILDEATATTLQQAAWDAVQHLNALREKDVN